MILISGMCEVSMLISGCVICSKSLSVFETKLSVPWVESQMFGEAGGSRLDYFKMVSSKNVLKISVLI